MRKDIQLINEIKKLRKILNNSTGVFTEVQKDKAWYILLTLQWVRDLELTEITPLHFCGIHGPSFKQYLKRDKK